MLLILSCKFHDWSIPHDSRWGCWWRLHVCASAQKKCPKVGCSPAPRFWMSRMTSKLVWFLKDRTNSNWTGVAWFFFKDSRLYCAEMWSSIFISNSEKFRSLIWEKLRPNLWPLWPAWLHRRTGLGLLQGRPAHGPRSKCRGGEPRFHGKMTEID